LYWRSPASFCHKIPPFHAPLFFSLPRQVFFPFSCRQMVRIFFLFFRFEFFTGVARLVIPPFRPVVRTVSFPHSSNSSPFLSRVGPFFFFCSVVRRVHVSLPPLRESLFCHWHKYSSFYLRAFLGSRPWGCSFWPIYVNDLLSSIFSHDWSRVIAFSFPQRVPWNVEAPLPDERPPLLLFFFFFPTLLFPKVFDVP